MKILLINPRWAHIYGPYKYAAETSRIPPTGLLYLAAYLFKCCKQKHHIRIIDAEAERLSYGNIQRSIETLNPDIVGISSTTPLFPEAKKIASIAKQVSKETCVICGGPHVTALPKESLQECESIDIIVRGEGEITFSELVSALEVEEEISKIDGIAFRDRGEIQLTPPRAFVENLDTLPFPARQLIKNNLYKYSALVSEEFTLTTMETSRGCPYNCIFCYPMFGKKIRFRSVENVLDEMNEVVHKFRVNFIYFIDDTMTLNRKRMVNLCQEIINAGLHEKVRWFCTTRVDSVDKEMLLKMKQSGCVRVNFGVESGNPEILRITRKGITLEQARRAFKGAREVGLETVAYFILGHPYETKKTIKDTIKFAKNLDPTYAEFSIMTPFPGTELYQMIRRQEGGLKLKVKDWGKFAHYGNVVTELNGIPTEDLVKFQKHAFREFYLRPKKILGYLKTMDLRVAMKTAYAFVKSNL